MREGDGREVGPFTRQVVKRVMTQMEVAGGYVKQNGSSGWPMAWQVKTVVLC
jgi:hypothetical protein